MTEIRPLSMLDTIHDTIERVLPTARSSAELQRWCTQLASVARTNHSLATACIAAHGGLEVERDRLIRENRYLANDLEHLIRENRYLVDSNLELEILVGAGHTRKKNEELSAKYQAEEQGRIDLAFAIEPLRQIAGRVIAAYRAAGVLGDVPDPTTTELLAMMDAAPDTAEESARLDREGAHMDELNRRMRWAEGGGDA